MTLYWKPAENALNVGDLQEMLHLDFVLLNRSLAQVGLGPITYPDIHRNQMVNFLRENEIRIINALRVAHAGPLGLKQQAPSTLKPARRYETLSRTLSGSRL